MVLEGGDGGKMDAWGGWKGEWSKTYRRKEDSNALYSRVGS